MSVTGAIIITITSLLLLAYFFDITTSKSRIPSVILLLLMGWIIKQITIIAHIPIPNLSPVLPLFGTVGLILIVLEGAIELEFSRSKAPLILKSSLIAIGSILIISLFMAFLLYWLSDAPFRNCLLNSVPLAVISSAIAIPSTRNFEATKKEFIVYESSISDVFGVILFNFLLYNERFHFGAVGIFFLQFILLILIAIIVTILLLILLRKLKHHVKYTPIILMIILVYSIAKEFHLPALLFVLLLGLTFSNFNKFSRFYFIEALHPQTLQSEITKLKEVLVELTFLIRSMFFLLFGFMISTEQIINPNTLILSIIVVLIIFTSRWLFLLSFNEPTQPLLYIAPRGLITVLLFFSIPASLMHPLINDSLIAQIIIISAMIMMYGIIKYRPTAPVN